MSFRLLKKPFRCDLLKRYFMRNIMKLVKRKEEEMKWEKCVIDVGMWLQII